MYCFPFLYSREARLERDISKYLNQNTALQFELRVRREKLLKNIKTTESRVLDVKNYYGKEESLREMKKIKKMKEDTDQLQAILENLESLHRTMIEGRETMRVKEMMRKGSNIMKKQNEKLADAEDIMEECMNQMDDLKRSADVLGALDMDEMELEEELDALELNSLYISQEAEIDYDKQALLPFSENGEVVGYREESAEMAH